MNNNDKMRKTDFDFAFHNSDTIICDENYKFNVKVFIEL